MGKPAMRRTQGERTAQTRAALITAARRLFGAEGFAEVGAERVAREAGMTRGALYHQFADKADLFAAVLDEVEAEIAQRVAAAVAGDRKSTRLNSSHTVISYAVFCLKK